jgi:hypothetical protein
MGRRTESYDPKTLKKIFFWSDEHLPGNCITDAIPSLKRLALAGVLMGGDEVNSYRGLALCRMPKCGQFLGSQDLTAYGYMFPSRCEHYVLQHGVWLPECEDLLELALGSIRRS